MRGGLSEFFASTGNLQVRIVGHFDIPVPKTKSRLLLPSQTHLTGSRAHADDADAACEDRTVRNVLRAGAVSDRPGKNLMHDDVLKNQSNFPVCAPRSAMERLRKVSRVVNGTVCMTSGQASGLSLQCQCDVSFARISHFEY